MERQNLNSQARPYDVSVGRLYVTILSLIKSMFVCIFALFYTGRIFILTKLFLSRLESI